jgi:diguanylate cyclase (GGDEF)-like protein
MTPSLRAILRPMAVPVAVLVLATLAVWLGPALPETLAGLRTAGPIALFGVGFALAWWYNRARAFVFLASLFAAHGGYLYALSLGGFSAKAVYTALVVLVPLNVLIALWQPERGVRYRAGYRWIFAIAAQALIVLWIASAGKTMFSGTAWQQIFEHWALRSPPTPLVGRLAFAAAFIAAAWRAYPEHRPLEVGLAGALVAFFIAAEWAGSRGVFAVFLSAAGLILIVALLQESHRLAFRDELTGLPGRRALEEGLRALREGYTIAMVDVDRFKQFNDEHGHDVGDQVLKLVGARLGEVGGGGRAFRYGGEEFAVLFAGLSLKEALAHLEALRAGIEGYRMAVRGADRPRQAEHGVRRRAGRQPGETLSVTVSIGAAEPARDDQTPAQVIRAADEALYEAKKAGRNRVHGA